MIESATSIEAQREHDRTVALGEELRKRMAAAEIRERIDALAKRKAAAEAECVAVAELVDARCPGHPRRAAGDGSPQHGRHG